MILLTIVATGPLTSEALTEQIRQLSGEGDLYFHDAISPIVNAQTIDYDQAFFASRHDDGEVGDYLNCPLTKEEYLRFHEALTQATVVPFHTFEEPRYFEACLPIEEIARRGVDALAYGPMRPVGLVDSQGRRDFYAVAQLRREDQMGSAFNLVGFQTKMTYPEQKRVLRLIPGLQQAEFLRFGSLHRNTYLNSPKLLRDTLQLRSRDDLFFAGQITGVEGYTESVATGLLAGLNAVRLSQGADLLVPPPSTALGALVRYIAYATAEPFQPMNINFGLLPDLPHRVRGKGERRRQMVQRALTAAGAMARRVGRISGRVMARASASKQSSPRSNKQAALEAGGTQAASEVPFVREFHRYLNVEHNASRHTLDAYRRDLRQFFEFLAHSSGAQASIAPLSKASPLRARSK